MPESTETAVENAAEAEATTVTVAPEAATEASEEPTVLQTITPAESPLTSEDAPAIPVRIIESMPGALEKIAEANQVIRSKASEINKLGSRVEELKKEEQRLSANVEELRNEAKGIFDSNKASERAKETMQKTVEEGVSMREEAVAMKEAELEAREAEIAGRETKVADQVREVDLTFAKSREKSDKAESVSAEALRLKDLYEKESVRLANERRLLEVENKKAEVLKSEILKLKKDTEAKTKRLKEFEGETSNQSESFSKERAEIAESAEKARREISAADFLKNEAQKIVTIVRQELHRYVQIAGVAISIPELTEDHKKICAETLLEGTAYSVVEKPVTAE
jgi:chromosome segregation ATPase